MRHTKTRQMLKYWLSLNENNTPARDSLDRGIWPERSDINPADCANLLGDMLILDVDNGQANYRLAGTRLCALHGRELKNECFSGGYQEQDKEAAGSWVRNVGSDDYLALICSDAQSEQGDVLPLETLILPLNHHGVSNRRALGITVPLENPYWLGSTRIESQKIRSVRVLRPWEDAINNNTVPFTHDQTNREKVTPPATQTSFVHLAQKPLPANETDTSVPRANGAPFLRVLEGGKQ